MKNEEPRTLFRKPPLHEGNGGGESTFRKDTGAVSFGVDFLPLEIHLETWTSSSIVLLYRVIAKPVNDEQKRLLSRIVFLEFVLSDTVFIII